jgi:hypothetical protein
VLPALGRARHKQGLLLGQMRHLGFDLRAEAAVEVLTSDDVRSSAVEAGPMHVVSGPLGRERVHFEAPAAERKQ